MALLTSRFVRPFAAALASVVATAGLSSSLWAQSGPAFPGARYASGGNPDAIAEGDVNGDGKRDLVAANGNETVTVLLGVGGGAFGAGTSYPSGGAGTSIALAHWNGDGILDIAVGHGGFTTEISVLLSTGPGTYAAPVKLAAGSGAFGVAAGDFNADGNADLAATGSSSNNATVYLGNGAGVLTLAGAFAAGSQPHAVVAVDTSGDGKLDLVAANFSGAISVLLGTGTGTFTPIGSTAAGGLCDAVAAGDVNNNGTADVAVTNYFGNVNATVLLGAGNGTFAMSASLVAGEIFPSAVQLADATGDGKRDVLLTSTIPTTLTLFPGNGSGGFGALTRHTAGNGASGIAANDFNGDGRLDAAVTCSSPQAVCVLLGKVGGFESAANTDVNTDPRGLASADFNNDGKRDAVTANFGTNDLSLVLGDGTGALGAAANFAAGAGPRAVAAGDLNGNGSQDAVVVNSGANNASIHLGNGAGGFAAPATVSVGTTPVALALGDWNNDSILDLAVVNSGSNNLTVRLGNGSGGFGSASTFAVGTSPSAICVLDVNNNGVKDLAVANSTSNNVSVLLGNGSGGFGVATAFAAGTGPSGVASADFNGNGVADLAVSNLTSSNVSVLLGNGIGGFAAATSYLTGGAPNSIVALALDGDSLADVAVGIETPWTAALLTGTGTGVLNAPKNFALAGGVKALHAADFNGDARPDLASANGPTADVSVLRNQLLPPVIVTQPVDLTVCQGAPASFSVVANNALTFQWRKNGAPLANGGGISGATTANLSIASAAPASAGAYDCQVGNTFGTVTSSAAVLTVNGLPVITGQPQGQTVCAGSPASFTVTAAPATGYQWRKNGVNIGGATSNAYVIASTVPGDAGSYDCIVSNACGSTPSSSAALAVAAGVPVVTLNPLTQSACAGSSVILTMAATGAASFQWRKNTVNIGGATSTSLTLNPVTLGDAASYDCVATNACGSATTSAAVLTVFSGNPSITVPPVGQSACAGGSAMFSVTATNAAGYQWRKNGVNIGGATAPSLLLNPVVAGDAANYDVVVSNSCGSVTSVTATLTVYIGNPSISLPPVSTAACTGGSALFGVTASQVATYQWRKDGVNIGGATASTLVINPVVAGSAGVYDVVLTNSCGTTISPTATLTVYTGNPSISLPPISTAACVGGSALFGVTASQVATYQWRKDGVNIGGATASTLVINPVVAGSAGVYDVVLTNSCGTTISPSATLTVYTGNPSISLPPISTAACVGGSALFGVTASQVATYQWRKDGVNIGGATASTLVINPVVAGSAGAYDVVLTNSCGTTISPSAALTVFTGIPVVTLPPVSQSACAGGSVLFSVTATEVATYQWRKDGVNLGGATASTLVINPVVAGSAGAYDVVLTNACGATISPSAALTVFTGIPVVTLPPVSQSACAGGSVLFSVTANEAATYQWRKDGVNLGGATAATLVINPVVAGSAGSYDCVLGNACGSTTSPAATLLVSTGIPVVTIPPDSASACAGTAVNFSVTATGALTYQWRKDGVNIGGATSSAYGIASTVPGDAGAYDCVVTNACGSATSAAAVLTVSNGLPVITLHPTNDAECAGGSATFLVAATGAQQFQWRKDGLDVGGATFPSLTISPVGSGDNGSYDCVVTNACGSASSAAATLTVSTGPPSITDHPDAAIVCTGDPVSFTLTATGALEYQWRKDGVNIPGATASAYAIVSASALDAGVYDCVVTNACATVASSTAVLTISDILFVNAAAAGANTGKTWADAFTDLQSALASPRTTVQIWVAAGTYRPDQGTGSRAAAFQLVNGKSVYGGFAGTETLLTERDPAQHLTVLSGEIGAPGSGDNSFHVVTANGVNSSAVLDGFTVRDGNADAGSGGGLLVSGGTPTVRRCLFLGNRAGSGAGAAVELTATATLVNCTFLGNIATGNGGGLHLGAGVAATLVNGRISGNTASSGAGLYNGGTSLALHSSTLSKNAASGSGGGVRSTGALTFANSILWGNTDASGLTEAAQIDATGGSASGTYSILQGLSALAGTGNSGVNPDLVDADGADNVAGTADDDLRLTPYSPALDAGSSAALPADASDLDGDADLGEATPLDAYGNPRQLDDPLVVNTGVGPLPVVDIGAYEACTCDPLPFGTGTPGCNGTQVVGTNLPPEIDTPGFQLTCTNAPPSSLGLGLVGNVANPFGTDPFLIGVLLHVDLLFSTEILTFDFFSDPTGNGFVAAPIPNLPILVGQVYYAQGLWFWTTCALPPNNLSTTRGLKITILP